MNDKKASVIYGAELSDWNVLMENYGPRLLLPIVANPNLKISTRSTVIDIGKIPSVINSFGYVVGYGGWTTKVTTEAQVKEWSANSDYGIGINCNYVKAFDFDVDNNYELATQIHNLLYELFPDRAWPYRARMGSSRILIPFICEEVFGKGRLIFGDGGQLEILANGNQFVAYGYHAKSQTRLLWPEGGLENASTLSREEAVLFLNEIIKRFTPTAKLEWSGEHKERIKGESGYVDGEEVDDPLYKALYEKGLIDSEQRDGVYNIVCPLEHEHSTGRGAPTSTQYFAPGTDGYEFSSIKCLHSHGNSRNTRDYMLALGMEDPIVASDYGITALDIPEDSIETIDDIESSEAIARKKNMASRFHSDNIFGQITEENQIKWLVDDVISAKSLAMMYGPPGGGKSFLGLDMAYSIATNAVFSERYLCNNQGGQVLYIAAEGSQGVRRRINVIRQQRNLGLGPEASELLTIYEGSVNLADENETNEFIESVPMDNISLVIFDTLAANMQGDENKAEDGQKVIANCKTIIEKLETAVLLIHHTGKNEALGARGWSGFKGAMDSEINVSIHEDGIRLLRVTKLKDAETSGEFIPFKLETKYTDGPIIHKAKRERMDNGQLGLVEYDEHGKVIVVDMHETSTTVVWRGVEMPDVKSGGTSRELRADMGKVLEIMHRAEGQEFVLEELKKHPDFKGHAPERTGVRIAAAVQKLKDSGAIRVNGDRYSYIDSSRSKVVSIVGREVFQDSG